MTKKYIQSLSIIALFLWGFSSLYANESLPNICIHITPQTITKGFDKLNFTDKNAKIEIKTAHLAIYITENIIFTAPDELMQQVVFINASSNKTQTKNVTQTLNNNNKSKPVENIAKKQQFNPFGNLPFENSQKNIVAASASTTTNVNQTFYKTLETSTKPNDTLSFICLNHQPSFWQLAHTPIVAYNQAHTTRPPPTA